MPEFNKNIPLYLGVKEIHFEKVRKVGHFKYATLSREEINSFLSSFSDFYNVEYLDCKPSIALSKLQEFLADYGVFTSKEGVFRHSDPVLSGEFNSESFQWFCCRSRKKLKPFCVLRKSLGSTWGFTLNSPEYR